MGRLSAGVVVVRRMNNQLRYLVLRAYRNWDFPKGGLEAGETALDAALREVKEETGIERLNFRWGDEWIETLPYRAGKVARYYLAETDQAVYRLPINPKLGRPEHHEYRWVSDEEAHQLLPPRLQPVLDWARRKLGL